MEDYKLISDEKCKGEIQSSNTMYLHCTDCWWSLECMSHGAGHNINDESNSIDVTYTCGVMHLMLFLQNVGKFIARAVADDCLPPKFVSGFKGAVESKEAT